MRKFFSNFVRARNSEYRGRIFTTNYDVLLYWVVVEHQRQLNCWDGFAGADAPNRDYKWHERWMTEDRRHPLVWNIHGGLHIYEDHDQTLDTYKLNGQAPSANSLVDMIRQLMERGSQPLLVSENSSVKKLAFIKRHAYLHMALKKFWLICRSANDALFTFGHSLSQFDAHIIDLIGHGAIPKVYIGVHGPEAARRATDGSRYASRQTDPLSR